MGVDKLWEVGYYSQSVAAAAVKLRTERDVGKDAIRRLLLHEHGTNGGNGPRRTRRE